VFDRKHIINKFERVIIDPNHNKADDDKGSSFDREPIMDSVEPAIPIADNIDTNR
jgi:hypothetical protein